MASSGLLSKADKLTSSIIALESTMHKCLLAKTGSFFYHRALMVMNECIFMHAQTYTHMYVNSEHIQSSDTFAVKALILIVQNSIPVQGIFFQTTKGFTSTLCLALLSDLHEHVQCVLMLSVSSKKTPDTVTICIHFQTEGVKACSATVPVCLKSAKAL